MVFFLSILSHGLISSLIFFLIGIIYEQRFSRLIFLNKRMLLNFPILFFFFFFTFLVNIGIPPFLTFFSELYIFIEIINYSLNLLFLSILLIMLIFFFNIIFIKNLGIINIIKFFKIVNFKVNLIIVFFEHLFLIIYFL